MFEIIAGLVIVGLVGESAGQIARTAVKVAGGSEMLQDAAERVAKIAARHIVGTSSDASEEQ